MMKLLSYLKQIFCIHNFEEMCYRGVSHQSLCYKRKLMGNCTDPITKLPCEGCYIKCNKCGRFIGDFIGDSTCKA